MTKTSALTESFAAGEITPLLQGRVSSEGYKQGVKYLLNMLTDPRGALLRRPGFLKRGSIANKTEAGKATFKRSKNDSFDLVLTDLLITISPNLAQRLGIEAIENGSFLQLDTGWEDNSHTNASILFSELTKQCLLTPGILATEDAVIRRSITIDQQSVNHKLELFGIFPGQSAPEGLDISIGTSLGASDIYSGTLSGDVKYFFDNAVAVGANSQLYLEIKAKAQTSLSAVADVLTTYLDSVSLKPLITTPVTTTVITPYLEADVKEVHTHMTPDGLNMYFTHSDYPVQKLNYNSGTGVWTFAAVVFISPPAEWVAGSYPATMSIFQGRSFWGGLLNNEETFWASKSGSFEDLTIGVLPADAFKYKIAKAGLIKWIVGSKNLLIGTDNAEFVISSESGLITPTDINVDQQSAFGSGSIQPAELGTEVLYVSPDGRKLRTMGYSWTDSGWISQDLTEASEHITEDPIVSLAYARNPDSIIWMGTKSGGLISCAYRKIGGKTPVIGWHRHKVDGSITDISVMEDSGSSYLWMAIRRLISGEPSITYERITLTLDAIFTDGAIINAVNVAVTTITGLDHLEGKTVRPIVDGAVHPPVVVAAGQITLDTPGYYTVVGTHTNPKIITLPLVLYGQGLPVIYGRKRWPKIYVEVVKSAMPLIEGDRPPDRSPITPMGIVEPFTSGLVQVTGLGWDRGTLEIEQDLPLPLTIIAIAGEVKQNSI